MIDFYIGDRVHISDNYWCKPLAGRSGVVSLPNKEVSIFDGLHYRIGEDGKKIYWIDLVGDTEVLPGECDGAEISEDALVKQVS